MARRYDFSIKINYPNNTAETYGVTNCDSFDEAVKYVEDGIYKTQLARAKRKEEKKAEEKKVFEEKAKVEEKPVETPTQDIAQSPPPIIKKDDSVENDPVQNPDNGGESINK